MKIILKALAAASVLALGVAAAQAETATNTMDVQITIKDGCTVNFPENAGNINFGEYAAITEDLTLTKKVVINCKNASTTSTTAGQYTLALNEGMGTGATTAVRKLSSGSNTIDYTVYQAGSISSAVCGGKLWGSAAGETFTGTLTAATGTVSGDHTHFFTVCIPKITGTQPANGIYADTLTATLSY